MKGGDKMYILSEKEAGEAVDEVCAELGEGSIHQIRFIKGRCDACFVLRLSKKENGHNAIFLVLKNESGIRCKKVISGHFSKGHLTIGEPYEERQWFLVKIEGFGEYCADLLTLKLKPQSKSLLYN